MATHTINYEPGRWIFNTHTKALSSIAYTRLLGAGFLADGVNE